MSKCKAAFFTFLTIVPVAGGDLIISLVLSATPGKPVLRQHLCTPGQVQDPDSRVWCDVCSVFEGL